MVDDNGETNMASTATEALKAITRKLQDKVKTGDDAKAKFAESFLADPLYALGWAESTSRTIAQGIAAARLLKLLEAGKCTQYDDMYKFNALCEVTQDEAMRAARSPSRSTNPFRNIIEQDMGAAWGELAFELISHKKAIEE
jgi:hypothetical protein